MAFTTRILLAAAATAALGGCSLWTSGEKANPPTPLSEFVPSASLDVRFQSQVGSAGDFWFSPDETQGRAFAAGTDGLIRQVDGGVAISVGKPLSAGVGAGGGKVVVVSARGELMAYEANGRPAWQTAVGSEVLAAPLVGETTVLVRTGDGKLTGYDLGNGARKWQISRNQPALALRGYSAGTLDQDTAYVGLGGGKLLAIDLTRGTILWEATVALPRGATELERVTDVVGAPAVYGQQVCAVAYQGKVACFDTRNGQQQWSRDISSERGLSMDARNVYVTDSNGSIVAFDRRNGASAWKQDRLRYRAVSGPASLGRFVLVADGQGVLHALSADDGHLVARRQLDGSAVVAQPRVMNETVLVQTSNGSVYGISLR